MTDTRLQYLMLAFGIIFLAVGIIVQLGIWKSWYWKKQRMVYGYIPLGLLFILYAYNQIAQEQLGTTYMTFQVIGILLFAAGVWLSARPPAFIKPKWVRWVEAHPKKIVDAMMEAVRNGDDWRKKVESKESVDAWARGLKMKLPKQTSRTS